MKATLILENGIRLSAPISEQSGIELVNEFTAKLMARDTKAKLAAEPKSNLDARLETTTTNLVTPSYTKEPPPMTARPQSDTKLVVFQCDKCDKQVVVRLSKNTSVGDVVTCHCGNEMQIKKIQKAAGDCANCGQAFYQLSVVNEVNRIVCRKCDSDIDLAEKGDGTLTGMHNLKY